MTFNIMLGHKHVKQTKQNIIGLFIAATLLLVPQTVAAQTALTDTTNSFGAPIDMINGAAKDNVADVPSYSYTNAGSLVSSTPALTDKGIWEYKKETLNKKTVATRPPINLPTLASPLVMEGEASYYSKAGCLGCNPLFVMANGQALDDNALTMAIGADKVYLVGHQARVTNLANGKSVMVRITDTGGFYQAKYGYRVADLTIGSKQAIGMNGGVGHVKVEVF